MCPRSPARPRHHPACPEVRIELTPPSLPYRRAGLRRCREEPDLDHLELDLPSVDAPLRTSHARMEAQIESRLRGAGRPLRPLTRGRRLLPCPARTGPLGCGQVSQEHQEAPILVVRTARGTAHGMDACCRRANGAADGAGGAHRGDPVRGRGTDHDERVRRGARAAARGRRRELQAFQTRLRDTGRGLVLREVGGGWRLYTHPDAQPYLERFAATERATRCRRRPWRPWPSSPTSSRYREVRSPRSAASTPTMRCAP